MLPTIRLFILLAGLMILPEAAPAGDGSLPDAMTHMIGRPVIVELRRDVKVAGLLLPRTNDRYLWLSIETIGIRLESGYPWENVRTVVEADVPDANPFGPPTGPEGFEMQLIPLPAPALSPPPPPPPLVPDVGPPGPVCSLAVSALVDNFDADAESDGLSVLLFPLDDRGNVVPVSGQLELRLMVEDRRGPQRRSQIRSGQIRQAGHWTATLHPSDFTPEGAILELPFRRLVPTDDPGSSPYALLRATLSVPGTGTFDAEDPAVLLRPAALGPVPIDPQLQDLRWR